MQPDFYHGLLRPTERRRNHTQRMSLVRAAKTRRTTSLFMGMPNAKVICCAILGQPHVGFRRFMSTSAAMTSELERDAELGDPRRQHGGRREPRRAGRAVSVVVRQHGRRVREVVEVHLNSRLVATALQ